MNATQRNTDAKCRRMYSCSTFKYRRSISVQLFIAYCTQSALARSLAQHKCILDECTFRNQHHNTEHAMLPIVAQKHFACACNQRTQQLNWLERTCAFKSVRPPAKLRCSCAPRGCYDRSSVWKHMAKKQRAYFISSRALSSPMIVHQCNMLHMLHIVRTLENMCGNHSRTSSSSFASGIHRICQYSAGRH